MVIWSLLLPFAGGLLRVSWPVCIRPVIADDGLHRTYGKRRAFLTADGERDGAQNHAILPVTETTSIRAFAGPGVAANQGDSLSDTQWTSSNYLYAKT